MSDAPPPGAAALDDLPPPDMAYLERLLVRLLGTPSPSGRTDEIVQSIGEELSELGAPLEVTRRGALRLELDGSADQPARAITVHADTIGAIVREIKPDGRLRLSPVGTHSARFAEGARCSLFVDEPGVTYTGTVLPLLASGHRYGDAVDTQGVGWDHVELRLDERVSSDADVRSLGIDVGDHVAFDARAQVTPSGFVVSRHLDDKAGLAAVLAALRALVGAGCELPTPLEVLVTVSEEVGHGASHGLAHVSELVSVDNAVVAPGQQSTEFAVSVAMHDLHGPFDYHLSRRLTALCRHHAIAHHRDVFDYYRSDVAAALESGAATRAALVGVGIDASHGHERTHLDGIEALTRLVTAYALAPPTFTGWDTAPGRLADFPSRSVQPAPAQPSIPVSGRDGQHGAG